MNTFVARPVTTVMLYIGIVVIGIIGFHSLSVDFLPPVRIPRLTVKTAYENVSPQEIEGRVSIPIESTIGTVSGVKKVYSVSRDGSSVVTAEFYWGTNMDFALLEVREKLDRIRPTLPLDAGRSVILKVDPSTEPIMTIAIVPPRDTSVSDHAGTARQEQANGFRIAELKETSRSLIQRRIEQIEGVAQASVLGGANREIHVDIDMVKLLAFGLSLDDVSQALNRANVSLPGGSIKQGLFRYAIRVVGEFSSVEEIRSVVVDVAGGRLIRISDVGTVEDAFSDRLGLTRYNGDEVITIQVRKESGSNTIKVSQMVREVLHQLNEKVPGLSLVVLSDDAEFISKSVSDVESSIVIGALLAFLVLFLFLRNPIYPVIIGVTTPVSILATLAAMYFLQINLDIISLTGLAIGVGMLGDNAVVLIENVTRMREQGQSLQQATLNGAREINIAVTASTLTNVAVFLPIVLVRGVAAQLFFEMGVTMTIALLVSLITAVTLVPMLVSRDFTSRMRNARKYVQVPQENEKKAASRNLPWSAMRGIVGSRVSGIGRFAATTVGRARVQLGGYTNTITVGSRNALDRYLAWALHHRSIIVVCTVLLFSASIVAAMFIPLESSPSIDQRRFTIRIDLPKGTSFSEVSLFCEGVEKKIMALPGVESVYADVGVADEQNVWAVSEESMERALLVVHVEEGVSAQVIREETEQFLESEKKSLNAVSFAVKPKGTTFEQLLRPQPNDVRINVFGQDMEKSRVLAKELDDRIHRVAGLVNINAFDQEGTPEYRISIDREAASRYGLSVREVADHLARQVSGMRPTYLSDFDKKIGIRVRPNDIPGRSIDDVLSSVIVTPNGSIPVRDIVTCNARPGFSEIWRENQQRAIVTTANVSGRSIGAVVDDIEREAQALHPPAGYRISVGGENEEIRESFRSLISIIILSIFLVYMILASEYESFVYPLVILTTSPLAFIGAIVAMAVAGQHYNVMSLIGLVIMIGAVDNDAVIVVDVIVALQREGLDMETAIRKGMQQRLRPILMTTTTTVLGVLPLVLEFGTGSDLVRALTIPIVGGLIASTLFTIVAIPVVITYMYQWRSDSLKAQSATD